MIQLLVDNRERDLINTLTIMLVPHTVQVLEIGDIIFKDEEEIVLIIERKTINDLKASICDGRAREQKARLMDCVPDHSRIMYLIEGKLSTSLESKVSGMTVSTLVGSLINTQFRDNLKVYKTSTLDETANYIKHLLKKLESDKQTYFRFEQKKMDDVIYATTLKKKKKENLTPSVLFISQLAMIPQVTELISSEIRKVYPTMSNLIIEYERTPIELRGKMLSDITYPIKNDKTRRVGEKISERIHFMMYG